MSESVASIGSELAMHPVVAPEPSGPPVGTAAASTPGDSTTTATSPDGSITTTVVDALGNTVSLTTTRPDHPLSIEA